MSSSSYLLDVKRHLLDRGWDVSSTRVREDVYLVGGAQETLGSEKRLIGMVLTSRTGRVTEDHLRYLLKTAREKNADEVLLTAETGVGSEAKRVAANNGITVLERGAVDGGGSGDLGVEADDGSLADSGGGETDSSRWRGFVTRRRLVLGTGILIGGAFLLGGGNSGGPDEYDVEAVKSEAETIEYAELFQNVESYEDERIYYSAARIEQVIESDGDVYQFRIYVTQDGALWEDDLFGRWKGKRYLEGDLIEFWAVVNGTIQYETVLGAERTVPDVDIVDVNAIAEPEPGENVVVESEELVVEEDEFADEIFVEGVVENASEIDLGYVEVSVTLYDSDGAQMESRIDNTSSLPAGGSWRFEVQFFEEANEIDSYDVEVTNVG